VTIVPRHTRTLLVIAAGSLAAIMAAYALAPPDPGARAVTADVSSTWTALYAAICCVIAARRRADTDQRNAWWWLAAGCALFLGGQLVRDAYEWWRRVPLPYPSLADPGYLGAYVCFFIAIGKLVSAQSRRRPGPELRLDTVLVTLTAAALPYEFVLKHLWAAGDGAGAVAPVLTSLAWSVAGIAVLWLMLVELLRATRIPVATVGFVMPGLAVLCLTNLVYAAGAPSGGFRSSGGLDVGWDVGFLLLACAAALAPPSPSSPAHSARHMAGLPTVSGRVSQLVAVIVGLAGITAIALHRALAPEPDLAGAVLVAGGAAVIGARFVYSLQTDRRYTELLEHEVASQTRSLMDSLAATAAAERNLRAVMDALPDTIMVVDREGRILESNAPGEGMAPTGDASPTGRSVFDLLDPEAAAMVGERMAAAFRGEVQRFEAPFVRADGTRGISAMLYAPVREGSGITRILVLARDATDQRRTEAQLQQAEKLTAMGQLVSGVAHEINNPAAIISGFAQTLLLDELKTEHREMLQMVYDEATRIGRITSNLLAFARAGGKQRTLVDLNDIVRRTCALRSYHLSTLNITVALELDPGEPKIWADASEVQQILLNLLINAEQALMTVDTSRTITLRSRADEREVVLELADSGPGIPSEIRGKIFDPFFTTKPEGVGTGLGLSICYGIAQEHGGRIWVDSEPGHGACFSVALPRDPRQDARAPLEATPTPSAPNAPSPAAGALTVLVVDDETALRNALLRFLTRRGIQGQGVADGAAALGALRQRTFDVIISDVRMPGMSGREFLERLRHDRPEMVRRLVFSTGDTFAADTAALIKESRVPTVTKPFDFAALERVIRKVAARETPARPMASA